MFSRLRRLVSRFFRRSRTINNEPLNKVSLIVIILIDIFILVNVFIGLNDISNWYLSPFQAYPCYSNWNSYRTDTSLNKDYEMIRRSLPYSGGRPLSQRQSYQQGAIDHLGTVSETCLTYANYQDQLNTPDIRQLATTIDQKEQAVSKLEQANQTIRSQYDSSLLEKLAGQPRDQSINLVGAEKAKQTLDQNTVKITNLKQEIKTLQTQLLKTPAGATFLGFLKNDGQYQTVEKGYQNAAFWYPTIQLVFQSIFLLPLILIALTVHRFAQRRGYGLMALLSWHLLVIFLIPLILKIFEFLQVGAIFQFVFDIVRALLGGLLFLVSYIYILLIPLFGFGLIKFFQKVVFNPKVQAANRVQKGLCMRCAKQLRREDVYCPHCGYYQYVECSNCHHSTYKHLPYCKECGHVQS